MLKSNVADLLSSVLGSPDGLVHATINCYKLAVSRRRRRLGRAHHIERESRGHLCNAFGKVHGSQIQICAIHGEEKTTRRQYVATRWRKRRLRLVHRALVVMPGWGRNHPLTLGHLFAVSCSLRRRIAKGPVRLSFRNASSGQSFTRLSSGKPSAFLADTVKVARRGVYQMLGQHARCLSGNLSTVAVLRVSGRQATSIGRYFARFLRYTVTRLPIISAKLVLPERKRYAARNDGR